MKKYTLLICLSFLISFCYSQDDREIELIYVEKSKIQKEFYSFEELEEFIKESGEKLKEGKVYAVSELSVEALIFVEPPDSEGLDDKDSEEGNLNSENWEGFVNGLKSFIDQENAFKFSQKKSEKELVELAIEGSMTNKNIPDFLKSTKGLKKDKSIWFAENRFSL